MVRCCPSSLTTASSQKTEIITDTNSNLRNNEYICGNIKISYNMLCVSFNPKVLYQR